MTNSERPREAVKAKGQASSMKKDTSSSRTGNTVTDMSPICKERKKNSFHKHSTEYHSTVFLTDNIFIQPDFTVAFKPAETYYALWTVEKYVWHPTGSGGGDLHTICAFRKHSSTTLSWSGMLGVFRFSSPTQIGTHTHLSTCVLFFSLVFKRVSINLLEVLCIPDPMTLWLSLHLCTNSNGILHYGIKRKYNKETLQTLLEFKLWSLKFIEIKVEPGCNTEMKSHLTDLSCLFSYCVMREMRSVCTYRVTKSGPLV